MATDVKNDANLSTSLVSYWELEESSGTRVDSHGSDDMTDNNTVTSTTGKQGNAAVFVAANTEFLDSADSAALSITGDMSVAGWFYLSSFTGQHGIFSKDEGQPNRSYSFLLNYSDPDSYVGMYNSSDGTNANTTGIIQIKYTSGFSTGTWYHIALAS